MPRCIVIGTLTLAPGKRAIAEGIADQGVGMFKEMPGFVSVRFFLNEATNEYGGVSEWESEEAARAADEVLNPGFAQAFGEHLEGQITSRFYEVYEPKGS